MPKITGIILIFLCISVILVTGCTSTGSTSTASTATTIPTVARAQEPIIGVWRYIGASGFDIRYRINADGTYIGSMYVPSSGEKEFSGMWSVKGSNSYLFRDTGDSGAATIIYDPAQNGIYDTGTSSILLTPYQGNVAAASSTQMAVNTPTVARAQEPIIGVWRLSDSTGYDDRYRFNADGTYAESFYLGDSKPTIFRYGMWSAQGGNSYVTRETTTGRSNTIIYDPRQNAIYEKKYTTLLLTPYRGDVAVAS